MDNSKPIDSPHLSDLDSALTLAATEELIHGMGMVHLPTCTYISIDKLVREFYSRFSPWRQKNISNTLKDYDPNRQAVIMDESGILYVFPLMQKHIDIRVNKRLELPN